MSIEEVIKLARQPLPSIKSHSALKGNTHATGGGPFSHPLATDDLIANDYRGGQ